MSKFIQHPFDFQVRSAIRREACAIRKELNLTSVAQLILLANTPIPEMTTLVALPSYQDEMGSDPIGTALELLQAYDSQGSFGYNPGITSEAEIRLNPNFYFSESISLVAIPGFTEEGGTDGIETPMETLLTFSAQGSGGYNSGMTAEPEVTVI